MDIVERLRGLAGLPYTDRSFYREWGEAADEIERLRAALEEIAECFCTSPNCNAVNVSAEALKPSENPPSTEPLVF